MIHRWMSIPAVTVLAVISQPAASHHSAAAFDQTKTKEVTGTVRQFQWTNPHCYIQLLVKNDKGVEEEWSLEMGAPMHLYANGWRPKTIAPGDRITVVIHPLRNGGLGGEVQSAMTVAGKRLGKSA